MRSERARVKVRRRKSELNTEASFLHLFSGADKSGKILTNLNGLSINVITPGIMDLVLCFRDPIFPRSRVHRDLVSRSFWAFPSSEGRSV